MSTKTQDTTDAPKSDTSIIRRLFEAGAHFGFSKSRRHPTVTPYLYGTKQGTDIFDLEKTSALLSDAQTFLEGLGKEGKGLLFIGTKEEVSHIVAACAERLGAPYVINRWIGGTFTNFSEIKKRIERLLMLNAQTESGELERKYTKKERLMLKREVEKLDYNFGGIANMERLPAAIVVVDPRHEAIAVREAHDMGIPIIAVMGSDCNVTLVTKPVIVNDSHTGSVSLALEELMSAYEKGKTAGASQSTAKQTESQTTTKTPLKSDT